MDVHSHELKIKDTRLGTKRQVGARKYKSSQHKMNACYVCIPNNEKETKKVIDTGRRWETESEGMHQYTHRHSAKGRDGGLESATEFWVEP